MAICNCVTAPLSTNTTDSARARMYDIVSRLPGFVSVKLFKADDGEELTVFRFASEEALEAWRTHPEHVETMKRGHAEFYASGFLQICKVIREVGPFEHA